MPGESLQDVTAVIRTVETFVHFLTWLLTFIAAVCPHSEILLSDFSLNTNISLALSGAVIRSPDQIR